MVFRQGLTRTEFLEDEDEDIQYEGITESRSTFAQFAQRSSLHGIQYFSDPPRSSSQGSKNSKSNLHAKSFWTVSLMVSLIGFVVCYSSVFGRLVRGPIVVGVANNPVPIWHIPFPAITICPETKAKSSVLNFTAVYNQYQKEKSYKDIDFKTIKHLEAMSLVCDPHILADFHLGNHWALTSADLMKDLKDISPSLEDSMFTCKQRSQLVDSCSSLFTEIWTEDGLCFTSNSLNSAELFTNEMTPEFAPLKHSQSASSHWHPASGYLGHKPSEPAYPQRAHSAGQRGGLVVIMQQLEADLDYLCRGPIQGYKVILHSPHESPFVSRHYFRAPLNHETLVTIRPKVEQASEDLRGYSAAKRHCYLDGERKLQFYRAYSQRNCEIECLSNYFLKQCGCTRFSMPRNSSAPVCLSKSVQCLDKAEAALLDLNQMNGLSNDGLSDTPCSCLPPCSGTEYAVDVSQSTLDWKHMFDAHQSPLTEFPEMHLTRMSFVFEQNQFTPTKRYVLFSTTDGLALTGGLLGLFFGASLLSLVEIVYAFGYRRVLAVWQRRDNMGIARI